jgi:hypothetical protein
MPYTIEGAIEKLRLADAIRALEFYVCHTDGKTHAFSARCWEALNDKKNADRLVRELNEAIQPVKERWLEAILADVKSGFPKSRERLEDDC